MIHVGDQLGCRGQEIDPLDNAVARRLLREANSALSKPDQWRYGTSGLMAVDVGGGHVYLHPDDGL